MSIENKTTQIKQNVLSPSGVASAIRFMRDTGISLYIHGPPGISKSAVARQEADRFGIAFIDFRLTSVAPEDIRGVPAMDTVGGLQGMVWTPPLVFPRDLDLFGIADSGTISFYNPIGNNGIHYCKEPEIVVKALEPGLQACLIDKSANKFTVVLRNGKDEIVTGKICWTVTGKSEAILGLEEFNSAEPAVMAAAYQLILDRRVGDYVVPDGVMIVAMGNRDGDKGVTFKIPKPVANRFVHIEMQIDFDDWQNWAIDNDIHSDIIGFLTKWKTHLFDENFASDPSLSFATPRSWEFVSKLIKSQEGNDHVLRALICGAIGTTVAVNFLSHRDYMSGMPDVQDIFSGAVTTFNPNSDYKVQIAYSLCVQMCHALKIESDIIDRKYNGDKRIINKSPERIDLDKKMNNAMGYAMDNFSPEVMIVFNRLALQNYKLRFNSNTMGRFSEFVHANIKDIGL